MRNNKLIILAFALLLSTASYAQTGDVFASGNQQNQIELYPNPAVDYLIVDLSKSDIHNVEFELHSMIGNKIRIQPEEVGSDRYRIPLKEFATGYYFLVVKDNFSRFKKAYKFLKN